MTEWQLAGKPALILIHMQHGITHEDGGCAPFGHARATRASGVIGRQQALLARFREKGLPVVFINAITGETPRVPSYGRFWPSLQTFGANMPGSKDLEVIPELAPGPEEPVLFNWPFGIFTGTNLQQRLQELKVETLVMVGVATEMAVLASIMQAADLFYSIIVPSDASTSANPTAHDVVMNMVIPPLALATTTDEVLARL